MGISRNKIKKKRAIFLDRDGVLNPASGVDIYNNPESPLRFKDYKLFPFVAEAIRKINDMKYLAIVVTNQPAYAKGKMTAKDLAKMHQLLMNESQRDGGRIEKIYACLHHPDPQQVVVKHLLIDCECRKPKPGMILSAAREFNISLEQSWMIGDSWKDIAAGHSAGCRTIFIGQEKKHDGKIEPNAVAKDLLEALKIIERR